MHDDPFPFEYQNPNCDPFAFGGIDWCGFTPDADELRWQERQREEKLVEGAIAYFQEEEEEKKIFQMDLETGKPVDPQDLKIASSSSRASEVPKTAERQRLWKNNPSRPYIFGQKTPDIIA